MYVNSGHRLAQKFEKLNTALLQAHPSCYETLRVVCPWVVEPDNLGTMLTGRRADITGGAAGTTDGMGRKPGHRVWGMDIRFRISVPEATDRYRMLIASLTGRDKISWNPPNYTLRVYSKRSISLGSDLGIDSPDHVCSDIVVESTPAYGGYRVISERSFWESR